MGKVAHYDRIDTAFTYMDKLLDDLKEKLPDKYFPDKMLDLLDYIYSYITITNYNNSIEDLDSVK